MNVCFFLFIDFQAEVNKCSVVFTHSWMAFVDSDLFRRIEEIEQRFDQIEAILRNIQLIYSKVLFEIVLLANSTFFCC
ncbi:Peptide chain release factor [Trichinella spiralis]|uniref:Peptide chain release factor n=1 Tax=Trichinella spiralis TaxID=6334 RepID=A0ABR3KQN0_TRISP